MRARPTLLITPAGSCLVLLCILLGISVTFRVYAYSHPFAADGPTAVAVSRPPIDLGAGVLLPRASAGRYLVPDGGCARPALVTFTWVGPYGSDPSLADTVHPADRAVYFYRGWNLGHRFATVGLNAIYFARLAYARFTTGRNPSFDEVAVKIVMPAGCDAAPDDVLATFRRQASTSN